MDVNPSDDPEWFSPNSTVWQRIETDETAKKPDQMKLMASSEEEREAIGQLEEVIASQAATPGTVSPRDNVSRFL